MATRLISFLVHVIVCAAAMLAFVSAPMKGNADSSLTPAPRVSPTSTSSPPPTATASAPPSAATPAAPPSGSINIAFDQIDRTIPLPATPPPLDNFAADLVMIQKAHQASGMDMTSDIAQSVISTIVQEALNQVPVIGGLLGAAAAQAQANAMRKRMEEQAKEMSQPVDVGYITRYYVYNGWTRSEVIGLVVIEKPEQDLKIFLDTKRKTYRLQDTAAPGPALAEDAAAATPAPIVTKADVTGSIGPVDAATVAGLPAAGYNLDATVSLTNSADPCHDGSFQVKQLSYLAQATEPVPQDDLQPSSLYSLALPDGCEVTMHQQVAGTPQPAGLMYLYRLVTVIRDPAAAAQPVPKEMSPQQSFMQRLQVTGLAANYMKVTERNNIRPCTSADAALFEIPADYRQVR